MYLTTHMSCLVQNPELGARFYKERALALPYYFKQRQCSHAVLLSAQGVSVLTQCREPVRSAHTLFQMTCLYCWDHYTEFEDDNRCPCPLPTDGSRCFNPRDGDHCCSQVDEVQNCRQWYYDPTNKFPDKFCHPHCRLDEDNLELQGQ
jgi:hypothetical protein